MYFFLLKQFFVILENSKYNTAAWDRRQSTQQYQLLPEISTVPRWQQKLPLDFYAAQGHRVTKEDFEAQVPLAFIGKRVPKGFRQPSCKVLMATLKSTTISCFGTWAAAGALSKGVTPRSFAT